MRLARVREARGKAALYAAAQGTVGIERQRPGFEPFRAPIGQLDLAALDVVRDHPERDIFDVDLPAEVAYLHHEHAFFVEKAHAPEKRPVQAPVRDRLPLVHERRVAEQTQAAVLQRRGAAQRLSALVEPLVASSSTPRQS